MPQLAATAESTESIIASTAAEDNENPNDAAAITAHAAKAVTTAAAAKK